MQNVFLNLSVFSVYIIVGEITMWLIHETFCTIIMMIGISKVKSIKTVEKKSQQGVRLDQV